VLQCVAVCCSVLQCVLWYILHRCATFDQYRALQCVAECCSVWQCVTMCCSVLQCVAVFAVCGSVLQCVVEQHEGHPNVT